MTPTDLISKSHIAAVVSDPRQQDNPIVECNTAFEVLTGYSQEQIIGRNCRFLSGEGTEPELTQALRDGIYAKQPVMVEILNYKADGTPFRNAVMIAPLFDADGEILYYLGSQVEVETTVADTGLTRRQIAIQAIDGLTKRQREILIQMAAGKLNKQIAYDLGLSERTVKMHRTALIRGLDVGTSADAIRIAVEAGF
jgi:PAS domain S-box-containing protein